LAFWIFPAQSSSVPDLVAPLLVTSARRTFSSPASFGDGPPDFPAAAAVPLSSPFRPQSACWVFGYAPCRSRPVAQDGWNSPSPNPSSSSAAVASSCVTGFKTSQVTRRIFLLRFAAPFCSLLAFFYIWITPSCFVHRSEFSLGSAGEGFPPGPGLSSAPPTSPV
jgi:hypothetical protein